MTTHPPARYPLFALLALTGALFLFAGVSGNSMSTQGSVAATPFADGERWCVLGDSITHAGSYHKDVELFYLTRYPEKSLTVFNCGIAGDDAPGALRRLEWDCLNNRPSVVSLMLGMNDVRGGLYASRPDATISEKRAEANAAYETNMLTLSSRLLASGARLILITPSPYDDTAVDSDASKFASNHPGQSEALRGYARKVEGWGTSLKVPVVDFNAPMTAIMEANQKTNASFTLIGKDRVHPGPVGHLVMAYEFLKAQGVNGTVASIGIDASNGKELCSSNCRISNIRAGSGGVSFSCLENSLPYPLTKEQLPALDLIPFTKDLNREILRVTGLPPGNYGLDIDRTRIRNYTAAQLEEGVNLATETNTPQSLQSAEVLSAMNRKWECADKIRTIVFNENFALPDAPRPLTNDVTTISRTYDEKLAAKKTTNPYFTRVHEHYTDFKSHEAEIRAQMDQSLETARRRAIPRTHDFTISKTP